MPSPFPELTSREREILDLVARGQNNSAISFALGVVVFIGSYVFLFLSRKRNGLS